MSEWPRTAADRADARFAERERTRYPGWVEMWEQHKVCGCGDVLLFDRECREGICWVCRTTGARTPRVKRIDKNVRRNAQKALKEARGDG